MNKKKYYIYNKDLENITFSGSAYIVYKIGTEAIYKYNKKIDITAVNIKKHGEQLKNNNDYLIAEAETEKEIKVNICKIYNNKDEAIKEGIKNKNIYILDLKHNKRIYLLKNVYILYVYNKLKNDIYYIDEYNNIKEITENKDIKKSVIYNKIIKYSIDNITELKKYLIKDKYIIIKDNIYINE